MAKNPLRLSVQSAIRANDSLGGLFARIGTAEHPRGVILTAYRNARRAMVTALQERNPQIAAGEVLSGLRMDVSAGMRQIIEDALLNGSEEADRQMGYYGMDIQISYQDAPRDNIREADAAVAAVVAVVEQQAAFVRSVLDVALDPALILGDEERMGALAPAPVTRLASMWTAIMQWRGWEWFTGRTGLDGAFRKQCIAALDIHTTDCCLRAHAQIQPMGKPFHLTGTPRFADYVDYPPFHRYCRTAIVLYNPIFDDGITDEMRSGADKFLRERASGKRPNRRPADTYA